MGQSIHAWRSLEQLCLDVIGGFKHVDCLTGTPWILSLEKTWIFQLCMIASTLFWSNSMDTFNGPIVLRIHF